MSYIAIHPVDRGDSNLSVLFVLDLPSYQAGAEAVLAQLTLGAALVTLVTSPSAQPDARQCEKNCPGQDAQAYKHT